MFKDLTLKVTEVGEVITLRADTYDYQYQHVIPKHVCKSPRVLQVGDVVVVDKEPTENKDIIVKLALNPCGIECNFFLYDLRPKSN